MYLKMNLGGFQLVGPFENKTQYVLKMNFGDFQLVRPFETKTQGDQLYVNK